MRFADLTTPEAQTGEASCGALNGALNSPSTQRRHDLLDEVWNAVCKDRQNTYGDAEDNFTDIARHLTVHFQGRWGIPTTFFTPDDVAVICAYIKLSRLATSPKHRDNWVDLAGYAVCGGGIVASQPEKKRE